MTTTLLRLTLGLTVVLATASLLSDVPTQDGLVFLVAGELAWQGHTLPWPGMDDYDRFGEVYGQVSQQVPLTPFISLPQALPLSMGLSPSGLWGLRVVGGLSCVGVYLTAVQKCADPDARRGLDITVVLLLPLIVYTMRLGQVTPLLALAAALGTGRLCGVLLTLSVAFKAWPFAIFGVLLLRRSWTTLAWASGALTLLTIASLWLVPVLRWREILGAIFRSAPLDTSFNLSPVAWGSSGLLIVLALGTAIVWQIGRGKTERAIGAVWAGLAMLVPLVWAHYLLIPIAAVLVHVAPEMSRSLPGRALMWLGAVMSSAIFFLPSWTATVYGLCLVLTLVLHAFSSDFGRSEILSSVGTKARAG